MQIKRKRLLSLAWYLKKIKDLDTKKKLIANLQAITDTGKKIVLNLEDNKPFF